MLGPCAGVGTHHPLGPELVGTPPATPEPPPAEPGISRGAVGPEAAALPHFRARGAQQHPGILPCSSSSLRLPHGAAQWPVPVPLHGHHGAGGRRGWKQLGRQRDGTPARLVITARPRPSQAKPEPRGEQGKQERPSASTTVCPGPAPSGCFGTGALIPPLWYGWSAPCWL